MPELIRVRKKGQITIPKLVRLKLGIEEGDFLEVQIRDNNMVLRKLADKDHKAHALFGKRSEVKDSHDRY